MEERQHAILSASGAKRWLTCTPSAVLEAAENKEECSVYAEEGTAAHAFAENELLFYFKKINVDTYLLNKLELTNQYKQYVNKEFEEYVMVYVNYVIELFKGYEKVNRHPKIFLEVRVNFSNIVPQGFGTSDTLIVTDDTIHIVDLKFGVGVPVSAIDNPQLRLYGFGALNMFPNTQWVRMSIVQPRLDNDDTETLSKRELLKWALDFVAPRAEMAIKGIGKFTPTEDACRWCKLKGKCKARADMQLKEAQKEFEILDEPAEIQNLSAQQISTILTIAPKFIDWFKDVQAYALGQLMEGVEIPGYKLVEGRSTRIITNPDKVKEILLKVGFTEDDIMKPREMLGISKLEALCGKKTFAELFKDYLIKPQGKLTLAADEDRRPAVSTLNVARNEFALPIIED